MKAGRHSIVLVTAPNLKTARALARGAVREHLAACGNIVPGLESHYRWQGKIERGTEFLILFKTTRARLPALEKFVIAHHPYDTPEFIVMSLSGGNKRYLDWITASVCG
jgi:periplasmic divalent cation tolerance protein